MVPISLMMFYGLDSQYALALPRTVVSEKGFDTRRQRTGSRFTHPYFSPSNRPLALQSAQDATALCANSRGKSWTDSGSAPIGNKFKKKLQEEGKIQSGLTLKGLGHTVGDDPR
ncbi:hypothetical protein [Neorhizobium sp. LjRoot104]|uniref:hypothetical protein n=1 Tax=Neorhizobium sp. LjRoot104 TaxID=3342254 RepID=UPI003ECEB947